MVVEALVEAAMMFLSGSEGQEGSVTCPLVMYPVICSAVHTLLDMSGYRLATACVCLSYPERSRQDKDRNHGTGRVTVPAQTRLRITGPRDQVRTPHHVGHRKSSR